MNTNKPRVVKDYDNLSEELINEIKEKYPYGFEKHLITFKNAKGELVSAFPFEGEEYYYLVRMTKKEAIRIAEDDDDFEDDEDDEIGEEIMNDEISESDADD